jgi:hypothetical protein
MVLVPAREGMRLQAVGELDLAATPTLRKLSAELLAAGFKQLATDLPWSTFLDLAGVRLLLGLVQG